MEQKVLIKSQIIAITTDIKGDENTQTSLSLSRNQPHHPFTQNSKNLKTSFPPAKKSRSPFIRGNFVRKICNETPPLPI
ncbi:hypothetical protein C1H46_034627 [Malus baccata]|uniref:Uncharacterized protein n=1 Tax=Malus baccata TaxID=106549 RepID=A0A540L018_MALBA|nr:hypothetical protein C1H46_034627 [Malus baccata]